MLLASGASLMDNMLLEPKAIKQSQELIHKIKKRTSSLNLEKLQLLISLITEEIMFIRKNYRKTNFRSLFTKHGIRKIRKLTRPKEKQKPL